MTHLSVPDERKKQLDITPNLVRISIGVEDADDLIADFANALTGGLAPVLDRPAALLGEPAELAVRVHGDRLVRPFERGLVGHMVGVEADMAVRAFQA